MDDTPVTEYVPDPVPLDTTNEKTTENIVHKEPPRYGFINPAALQRSANPAVDAVQYQPQVGVMNMSPPPPYAYPGATVINSQVPHVESYKAWSVLNILCCCLILGFIACFYSTETEERRLRGDVQGALIASRNARTMNIIATVVGMIVITVVILYQVKVFH